MTHMPPFSRLATRPRAVRRGCAMALTLALAASPGGVSAQSFLGNGVPMGGEAIIAHTPGNTNITVIDPQVIINWDLPSSSLPGNPPEVFQPAGTTANFISGGSNDFTVLNRILPFDTVGGGPVSRAAQLNGTVTGPSNGSIWFYSPSGLVIGAGAAFNVGNLVLTSNEIDTTDGLYGPNGEIRFRGVASSLAPVEIQSGAVINAAAGPGTYLAIVAPRIVQAGTVRADGHVALVAAEEADIRMNAGLLDIVVTQGTTDPNGIIHTGSTGGPASGASDDRQVLSLIAMPKNTALTMLLSGSMGYTAAASAQDEGSSVVLSAGHADYLSNAELAQNLGSIAIGNSQFTSAVTALATNAIDIAPTGGNVEFQQTASLTAYRSVSAIAGDGESIIGRDLLGLYAKQGSSGGSALVRAEGGAIGGSITAPLLIVSTSGASETLFPQVGEAIAATGGTITLEATGGRIVADQLMLSATAYGIAGALIGGDGMGGSIAASVSGGGDISTFNFSANADGYGGFAGNAQQFGGNGSGGSIVLLDRGGALDLGQVALSANGFGGRANEQTGSAHGGTVSIDITTGTKNWSGLFVQADARGGEGFYYGGLAGDATGHADAVNLHVGSGATLSIEGPADLTANAYADVNGAGNTGSGGGIGVLVDGGATLRLGDTLNISAGAFTPPESQYYGPQTSPTLTGGTVNVLANGGTIETHALRASANAAGTSSAEMAGTATGGTATVGAANGGTIRTFAAFGAPGSVNIEANAYGGSGASPSDAIGGTATLFASDGALNVDGNIAVSASALGNSSGGEMPPGTGFSARGGTALVELRAGTTGTASLNAAGIAVIADGNPVSGGFGPLNNIGGSGTGGTARFSIAGGSLNVGPVTIKADGIGGSAETGGNGVGGTAAFHLDDRTAGAAPRSISTLSLFGRGIAGTSESGPAATETAGQTQLVANAGSPAGAITISGDFLAEATGAIAAAGDGFAADVGGAAFRVGGNTSIATSRDISMTITGSGSFETQGTLNLSTPRSLTATGLVNAAGGAMISAYRGITMSDLQSGGATLLSAAGGPITVSNDLSSTGLVTLIGPAANIRSRGSLTLGDVSTSGDFAIEAGGDLQTGTVSVIGNVALTSTGGMVQAGGTVSGSGIAIAAANGVIADADLISTGALQMQTGGTLRIGGRAIGTDITATSGDIAIGPNGSIGQRGITRSITLINSNPATTTFIGGATQPNGYSLDAAEATRLAADSSISLGLPMSAGLDAADLVIGNLALTYGTSGNIGTGGILKINAPGRITVNGAVALTTSSSTDRFSIDPTRIDINTEAGSISMQDANGGLLGQLELVGGTIAVASGATLAAIANLSNPMDINTALAAAPANPNDAGYLRAGSILLTAQSAIYIANTGASTANADRRGFTANSLSIITGSPATHVSINGVLIDSNGAIAGGENALPLIDINGQPATMRGLFSRFSTTNGCTMGQACNAPLISETIKTKSDIEVPLDPDGNAPQFTYIFEIDEREADDQKPLVDEPVTGVGNDDLWNGACGPDQSACPQGGNIQ